MNSTEFYKKLSVEIEKSFDSSLIENAFHYNQWFVQQFVSTRITSLAFYYSNYNEPKITKTILPKTIAIKVEETIPLELVNIVLMLLMTGHKVIYHVLERNDQLVQTFFKTVAQIDKNVTEHLSFTSNSFPKADAYIVDGSIPQKNLKQYFPTSIVFSYTRQASLAVLKGNESTEDLETLASDICIYFGKGNENVKKLLVPRNYKLDAVFEALEKFNFIKDCNHYINNFQYQYSIYLLNRDEFLENNFIILKQNKNLKSPAAVIYYDRYNDLSDVSALIKTQEDLCTIYSANAWYNHSQPFGNSINQCMNPDAKMLEFIKILNA